MPGTLRRTLIALWIGLHAALTLCGPALHALPGAGHDGPSASSRAVAGDEAEGLALSGSPHDAGDDCPVCHYLSQGQWHALSRPSITSSLIVARSEPLRTPAPPARTPSPSSPRAPPAPARFA